MLIGNGSRPQKKLRWGMKLAQISNVRHISTLGKFAQGQIRTLAKPLRDCESSYNGLTHP
jgi:hypothetical protein